MSNEKYSKSKVILEAVRSILVADNSNTGNEVREIEYYCSDRIHRGNLRTKSAFPQITFGIDEGYDELNLPSGHYYLSVSAHERFDSKYPQETLDNISSRIAFLLNKKPNQLNLATSKNLRCRLIVKISALLVQDYTNKVFTKSINFRMICGDEIFN
jgi:hypothetical protein